MTSSRVANTAWLWYNWGMDFDSESAAVFGGVIAANMDNAGEESTSAAPQQYPIYHNVFLWLIFGGLVLWIPAIYYILSSKHRWYLISKHEDDWLARFFYYLFHRKQTATIDEPLTAESLAKLKRAQEQGKLSGDIKFVAPDETIHTFKTVEDLEKYLKFIGVKIQSK